MKLLLIFVKICWHNIKLLFTHKILVLDGSCLLVDIKSTIAPFLKNYIYKENHETNDYIFHIKPSSFKCLHIMTHGIKTNHE